MTRISVQQGHISIPVSRSMCDYLNIDSVKQCITYSKPDVIINCAGLNQATSSKLDMLYINAIFPHILAEATREVPIIHNSSPEVFSGRIKTRYDVKDLADAGSYLGRAKSLGEVTGHNVCVVRSSVLAEDHGIIKSIAVRALHDNVEASKNMFGSYVLADDLCSVLIWLSARMIEDNNYAGLYHVGPESSISRYELVKLLVGVYSLTLNVIPTQQPVLNRTLKPTIILRDIGEALHASHLPVDQESLRLRAEGDQIAV